jgi:hypothetical protein
MFDDSNLHDYDNDDDDWRKEPDRVMRAEKALAEWYWRQREKLPIPDDLKAELDRAIAEGFLPS